MYLTQIRKTLEMDDDTHRKPGIWSHIVGKVGNKTNNITMDKLPTSTVCFIMTNQYATIYSTSTK